MFTIRNALRNISRAKGRSILIGIIITIIALAVCIGLCIRQSAADAKKTALSQIKITATISPDREKAMKEAFEAQLVQKVMPKLRGLETRGTQGDALTAIQKIIPETLEEDFKNALEQNYGQFIWTTSGYLLKDDNNGDKN